MVRSIKFYAEGFFFRVRTSLSITAILIHNATLPFSEDRDCKPFSACLCRHVYIFKTKTNEKCADSTLSKNYCRFIIGRMLQRQTNIYVNLKPVRLKALELENSCMVIVN